MTNIALVATSPSGLVDHVVAKGPLDDSSLTAGKHHWAREDMARTSLKPA